MLHDQGEVNGGAGGGVQFKGIFVRNLVKLYEEITQSSYNTFFTINADSIWSKTQGGNYQFGQVWSGPYSGASAGTQSSAIDAFIAAAQVTSSRHIP